MQINYDVWGTPDTWQQDTKYQNTSTMPDDYKFYRGQYPLISDYLDAKKLTIGEDIDYSMCYSAHGENMPMASLLAVATVQSEESSNHLEIVNCGASSAGWFFASTISQASTAFNINGARIIFEDRPGSWDDISDYYWKPKGTRPVSGNAQASERISPIVKFNPHGCYMAIRVRIMNQRTGAFTVLTLAALEAAIEDYQDDYVIVQAWADLYARRGVNTDTDYIPVLSNANYDTGICPNSDFVVGGIDFQKYSMFLQCGMPLFGFNGGGNPSQKTFTNYKDPLLHIPYVRPFYSNTASASIGYLFFATLPYTQADPYDNSLGFCYGIWADINEDNCEQLRKCAASYGLFFTDQAGSDYANDPERWTDEDMCLGVLDSDGIGHGEYTRGAANVNNPIFDWTSNTDSSYDPSKDIDPNKYDRTTLFNTTGYPVSFCKRYALSAQQVELLAAQLWEAMNQRPSEMGILDYSVDEFLTSNPIDTVVSLKKFPFNVDLDLIKRLYLGRYATSINAFESKQAIQTFDFTPIKYSPHFNDFRDYSPYSVARLIIPFCGTVEIDPAQFMGYWIGVRLAVDLTTGSCTAFIMQKTSAGDSGLCVDTIDGTAAIDIPVSGIQSATLTGDILRAAANNQAVKYDAQNLKMFGGFSVVSGVGGAISAATRLSIGGLVSSIGNIGTRMGNIVRQAQQTGIDQITSDYELHHVELPVKSVGSATPVLSSYIETRCRLLVYRPVMCEGYNPAVYGHTEGFATLQNGKVSDFSGFTVGDISVDGINCSNEEKAMIKAAFAKGVYL